MKLHTRGGLDDAIGHGGQTRAALLDDTIPGGRRAWVEPQDDAASAGYARLPAAGWCLRAGRDSAGEGLHDLVGDIEVREDFLHVVEVFEGIE